MRNEKRLIQTVEDCGEVRLRGSRVVGRRGGEGGGGEGAHTPGDNGSVCPSKVSVCFRARQRYI